MPLIVLPNPARAGEAPVLLPLLFWVFFVSSAPGGLRTALLPATRYGFTEIIRPAGCASLSSPALGVRLPTAFEVLQKEFKNVDETHRTEL